MARMRNNKNTREMKKVHTKKNTTRGIVREDGTENMINCDVNLALYKTLVKNIFSRCFKIHRLIMFVF